MADQFEKVDCARGAPMGRRGYGRQPGAGLRVRLFRVRLDSGGYDDGGAYWGIGAPLYCATDGADYREFIRAPSRFAACALLDLDPETLSRAVIIPGCYRINTYPNGNGRFLHVLHFWNDVISEHDSKHAATLGALAHYREQASKGAQP